MSRLREQALDRDQQILDRLAKIEHKVDSIEQTNAFALRPEAEKYFAEVKKIFKRSIRRAQVYLAADGARSVQEIAKHLGMQRQNVGPDLKHLGNEGLLELVDSRSNRDIWAKKPVDRTLRIGPFLCKEFDLQKNGLRQKPGKKSPTLKKKR
jgi:Fic family protein